MSNTPFPAIAEAQTETEAVMIPAVSAWEWMTQSAPWCGFIFGLVATPG